MHEDEHEEEILQSDDEIAMKLMINEGSSLLIVADDVAKHQSRDSTRSKRVSAETDLPLHCFQGSSSNRPKKEGGQAWSDHRLQPERVLPRKRGTTPSSLHLGTEVSFMNTGDHLGACADRTARPSSLCVYAEQLSTWSLLRSTMGALASSRKSSQTVEKPRGTWRSHESATSTRHSTKWEAFCSETTSLGATESKARKPVLRSARRVSSVTAGRTWQVCRTTSGARSREH